LVSDFVIKKVDEVSLSLLPKPTAKKNEKPNGYVLKCVSAEECSEWLEYLTNPLLSGGGGGQVFGKSLDSLPADENGIPKVLIKIISFLTTHGILFSPLSFFLSFFLSYLFLTKSLSSFFFSV